MIESPVLQRWEREKKAEAWHTMLHGALERRFKAVPPDVSAAARLIQDQSRVEALLDAAYSAATLDDFRAALTQ